MEGRFRQSFSRKIELMSKWRLQLASGTGNMDDGRKEDLNGFNRLWIRNWD